MSELILFEKKQVRRVWQGEAWWFVIADIVAALTDSPNPADYLKKLRKRDPQLSEAFKGGGQIIPPLALKFETAGGPQKLQCWNTPEVLRLISKATFGMTPSEYREHKSLGKTGENLRDHMTDLELIFTMLGEASTTEIAKKTEAQGFIANKDAAKAGGKIAGNARQELEKKSGAKVSTPENYKTLTEKAQIE